jgi:adenosylcobyric acid synthase
VAQWPTAEPCPIEGFELHRGSTTALEPLQALCQEEGLGWVQGQVAGSYLHGLLENGRWRRQWLNQLRRRKQLPELAEDQGHHSLQREELLDRLADAFEANVDLTPLLTDQ